MMYDLDLSDPRSPSVVRGEPWVWCWRGITSAEEVTGREGKWLIRSRTDAVHDRNWATVVDAMRSGLLGRTAKASTALTARGPGGLTCAYTTDADDLIDVQRVLDDLRVIGITRRLAYKADSTTVLGIHGPGEEMYIAASGSREIADQRDVVRVREARKRAEIDRARWSPRTVSTTNQPRST